MGPVRSSSLILLAAALVLATGAAAASGDMMLTASSHGATAKNVRTTVVLQYDMQCGYPGFAPAQITLPGAVPAHVARTAVLVNGKPARSVAVRGHTVVVGMPTRPQIICDVIGPGRLTVVLTSRARIANPANAGAYHVSVRKGSLTFSSPFAVV
jgi:hypothetical protein